MKRLAAVLVLAAPLAAQQGRVSPDTLVEQAMTLFPAYTGDHRAYLTPGQRRDVSAASKILEGALELDPDHLRALWWSGHAHVLLAHDGESRQDLESSRDHDRRAIEALTRAIERDPSDPWAWYARGTAHTHARRHWEAEDDLRRAVEAADALLRAPNPADNVAWVRFKALEWRPEVLMRMHAHERAREALDAFHAEFSNNGWPGLIARAESQLRERDFAAALATYEAITSEYGSDPEAHALAAYVHGLLGDRDAATAALQESIRRELQPGMYTRLWAVLLATQEHRPAAEAELRDFVDNAPQSVSAWDRTLGRFVLGAGGPAELLDAARLERGRRVEHGEPLADLMCEVWFYVGLRHEAAEERTDALAAYREVLSFRPRAFKWEWAYARLRFADLVQVVGCTTPGPTGLGLVTQPEREAWHVPRSARWTGDLGRSPRPGDLQLAVAVTEKGERRATLVVFGAN